MPFVIPAWLAAIAVAYLVAQAIEANQPATKAERKRREAKTGNRWFDRLYRHLTN